MLRARVVAVGAILSLCGTTWLACEDGGETTSATANSGGNSGSGGGDSGGGGGLLLDAGSGQGGSGGGMKGCDPQSFTLQQAPPAEVYLVIDRSGSMNDDGATPGQSKWQELNGAIDGAIAQYEDTIRFGLLMYPTGDECATSGPQVLFKDHNKTAITEALSNTTPAGGTPTAAALNNAAASLTDLGSPDSTKFVVLATDGGPNCNYFLDASQGCSCNYAQAEYCCTSHPSSCVFGSTCLDDQHTLDVMADLQAQGIGTFVIGLAGTAEYESLLNAMALSGGHPQLGGATDYYAVSDQASLLNALQTIAVSVISCQIELQQAPEIPNGVKVYIDGKEIPRDKTKMNGWDYTDGTNTTIELYGTACDTLQDGSQHDVTATFECTVN